MNNQPVIPSITMTPVKSRQIKSIGHDANTNTLAVQFNTGATYHYSGVTSENFSEFQNAESIGSHFGKTIKNNFPYTRLPDSKKGN